MTDRDIWDNPTTPIAIAAGAVGLGAIALHDKTQGAIGRAWDKLKGIKRPGKEDDGSSSGGGGSSGVDDAGVPAQVFEQPAPAPLPGPVAEPAFVEPSAAPSSTAPKWWENIGFIPGTRIPVPRSGGVGERLGFRFAEGIKASAEGAYEGLLGIGAGIGAALTPGGGSAEREAAREFASGGAERASQTVSAVGSGIAEAGRDVVSIVTSAPSAAKSAFAAFNSQVQRGNRAISRGVSRASSFFGSRF